MVTVKRDYAATYDANEAIEAVDRLKRLVSMQTWAKRVLGQYGSLRDFSQSKVRDNVKIAVAEIKRQQEEISELKAELQRRPKAKKKPKAKEKVTAA